MDDRELMDFARAETSLVDFGDSAFREGLHELVGSLEAEAQLTPIGVAAAEAMIRGQLANRLRIENYWRQHPELEEERIERPIFIVGMSRSGTTALSHLLSCDSRLRSLRGFEASDSVPPPERDRWQEDPRFLAARENENSLRALNPGFKAIHHDPPEMPVECLTLMAQHFVSLHFPTMFHVPSYLGWVLQREHTTLYRWHARVLKLLQSKFPGRWQLKSPHHALALDALLEQYPDARFIVTHRDPAVCVASTASLVTSLSGTFSEADRRRQTGELWTGALTRMAEGLLEFAKRRGGDAFVHVDYRGLVADPLGTVAQLYDALGEPLSMDTEIALAEHVRAHGQHRFGVHRYAASEFGLRRPALDERFASYRERFGVEREEGGGFEAGR